MFKHVMKFFVYGNYEHVIGFPEISFYFYIFLSTFLSINKKCQLSSLCNKVRKWGIKTFLHFPCIYCLLPIFDSLLSDH